MKLKKIFVCISHSEAERQRLVKETIVRLGFAVIPSDAGKLIRPSVHDFNRESYFVFAAFYKFDQSAVNRSLVERAMQGQAVVIGARHIPKELELFCEATY